MLRLQSTCLILLSMVMAASLAPRVMAVDVDVTITVDNAYGFGFGDVTGMTTTSYFGGLRNTSAADITNGLPMLYTAGDANIGNGYTNVGVGPEFYDLDALPASDYLYLVAWSDDTTLQGAIGSFTVGSTTLGTVPSIGWEVFATGRDRDSNVIGDTLTNSLGDIALINSMIAIANAETGGPGTSIGWVNDLGLLPSGGVGMGALAFGDDNTGGAGGTHPFGPINGIASSAQWMWYNEDPGSISNPFSAGPEGPDGHKEFLIFRIPVQAIAGPDIPEPTTALLSLLSITAIARRRRKA